MHPVIVEALAIERAKDLRAMGAGGPRNARSGHSAWRWRSARQRRLTAHGHAAADGVPAGASTTATFHRARASRSHP